MTDAQSFDDIGPWPVDDLAAPEEAEAWRLFMAALPSMDDALSL